MLALARTAVTPVWLVLMLATAISLWFGADHGLGLNNDTAITAIVMIVAFIKARFIGMYFMELRHAPLPLRVIFHLWYTAACTAILAIYLLS